MAFRTKLKNKAKISKDLIYDGGIQSHTRSLLVKEFLKYILYERQQIPVPYEQVKRGFKVSQEETDGLAERKSSYVSKMEHKKIAKLIENLEDIFKNIAETFEVCPEVRQILIILGGTAISPKESYLINFPPYHPESNNLSSKFCVRYLIKELISQDLVGMLKDIRTTNVIIMLKAPQDSGISWFLPKPNFSLPIRGEQFCFNLISNPNSDVFNHDLTHGEQDIDISGIEPFDLTEIDISLEEEMMKMFSINDRQNIEKYDKLPVIASVEKSRKLSVNNNFILAPEDDSLQLIMKSENSLKSEQTPVSGSDLSTCITPNSSSCDKTLLQKTIDNDKSSDVECIWFQAPLVIKGYKDKSSGRSTDVL